MLIRAPPLYIMRHDHLDLVPFHLLQPANTRQRFLCPRLINVNAARIAMAIVPGRDLPLSRKQP